MDVTTFMIMVDHFIDDWLKEKRARQRGPHPTLSDSEVLTIEVAGDILGMGDESMLYLCFCWRWAAWFPQLLNQ